MTAPSAPSPAPAGDAAAAAGTRGARLDPAWVVLLAGIGAALHVGKLPPAVGALQEALGMSLVEAGFALSLMQLAGMLFGVAFGALADGLGLQRSMVIGLVILALCSLAGAGAPTAAVLLATRALEGLGFLLVVLPAPALLRRWVAPERLPRVMGLWGAYMPLATALALLLGPLCLAWAGWRVWWGLLAGVCALLAGVLARTRAGLPGPAAGSPARAADDAPGGLAAPVAAPGRWSQRLRQTLGARGPWLVALSFAAYSSQWLAVVGFLPTIYVGAGLGAAVVAGLTALVAAGNIVGNVAAGRLLGRGVPAPRLLATGFTAMALCALAGFAGAGEAGLPGPLRYGALLGFSMVGGLIPGTLFSLAVRVAPGPETIATTVGWMQQWSAFGQFAGPPAVAWLTVQMGGWHTTWIATAACSAAGLVLSRGLARRLGTGVRVAPATAAGRLRR